VLISVFAGACVNAAGMFTAVAFALLKLAINVPVVGQTTPFPEVNVVAVGWLQFLELLLSQLLPVVLFVPLEPFHQ
jgi:hypothetical protein